MRSSETFFDPSDAGIPITTTKLPAPRVRKRWCISRPCGCTGVDSSVYFAFENVGTMAVFGIAFPTPNPSIAVKGTLPQTFLDTAAQQARTR